MTVDSSTVQQNDDADCVIGGSFEAKAPTTNDALNVEQCFILGLDRQVNCINANSYKTMNGNSGISQR